MTPVTFTLRVTMTSDWHVGTGAGRHGAIDRLLVRDHDGLPMVPAKTLVGVWRDAAETLALGLGGGEESPELNVWLGWVVALFGNEPGRRGAAPELAPVPARLDLRPARLPSELRDRLVGDEPGRRRLREALTLIKPGVAINAESGTATDDQLRFVELGRVDTMLEAKGELRLPEDQGQRRCALALLVASALLVERLGGKRRRGAGACKLDVLRLTEPEGMTSKEAVDLLRGWCKPNQPPPDPPEPPEIRPRAGVAGTPAQAGVADWVVVPLRLTLLTPLVVAQEARGNEVLTLDHLPGAKLLPFVHDRLKDLRLDPGRLVAEGRLAVLPAYLVLEDVRGLPAPLAFAQLKDTGEDGSYVNDLVDRRKAGRQYQPLRGGWVGDLRGDGGLPYLARTPTVFGTHATIEDAQQRPTGEVVGVFTYHALAAGLRLESELWIDAAALDVRTAGWTRALSQDAWRLGTAGKDDYGLVSIEALPEREGGSAGNATNEIVVWLTSDLLLRDEALSPASTLEALRRALDAALGGVGLAVVKRTEHGVDLPCAEIRTRRLESWQRGWGRPRPSLVGLMAGSCAVFTADREVSRDSLSRVEAAGLGERRAEGYGRIRFGDPRAAESGSGRALQKVRDRDVVAKPDGKNDALPKSSSTYDFAKAVEEAAWRAAIEEAAEQRAADSAWREQVFGWAPRQPSLTQLGNLREIVDGIHRDPKRGYERAASWLEKLGKAGGKDWKAESLRLLKPWLTDGSPAVWLELGLSDEDVPALVEPATDGRAKLGPFAVRAAVIAAIRAHRREVESLEQPT